MYDTSKLEETFNIQPLVIEGEYTSEDTDIVKSESAPVPVISSKLEDSEFIRVNLKELATSTKDALDLALQVQSDDPSARNTEAVAKMADAVAKMLSNLIHLNKTEKDEEFRAKPAPTPVINQNLTIMTTEEMISRIINQTKQLKEK
jgi:hypothetical protein